MLDKNVFMDRVQNLKSLLQNKFSAFLITNEINVGYFSGFYHSEGAFLVTDSTAYLLVDFRYYEAAQKYAVGCEVICYTNFTQDVTEILNKYDINSLFFESTDLTVKRFSNYSKVFAEKKIECIADGSLDDKITDIRIIKDESECAQILKAQQITEEAYLEVLNYLKPGVSEKSIALELEYLIKKKGGERVSFDLITITGKKTSLPHGVPSDDIVKEGDFFTMDIGSVFQGYHSDMTRTVAIKRADEEKKRVYDIVLKAQLAALEKIKSGVLCSDIDKTARDIITEAGYGEYFGHSTGHGVGLEIHEAPVVSSKSNQVLKSGMIITDEPGIYLPQKFGVRIEDMVCVTENGYRNFVSLPKELIIV